MSKPNQEAEVLTSRGEKLSDLRARAHREWEPFIVDEGQESPKELLQEHEPMGLA